MATIRRTILSMAVGLMMLLSTGWAAPLPDSLARIARQAQEQNCNYPACENATDYYAGLNVTHNLSEFLLTNQFGIDDIHSGLEYALNLACKFHKGTKNIGALSDVDDGDKFVRYAAEALEGDLCSLIREEVNTTKYSASINCGEPANVTAHFDEICSTWNFYKSSKAIRCSVTSEEIDAWICKSGLVNDKLVLGVYGKTDCPITSAPTTATTRVPPGTRTTVGDHSTTGGTTTGRTTNPRG